MKTEPVRALKWLLALLAGALALAPGAAAADPGQGPGGPILVVTGDSNPFGSYYAEILRNEGLNEFAVETRSNLTAGLLDGYDVVILGETPLTVAQATMLSDWVDGDGGNLIAMRPDAELEGLLGLTGSGTTLDEGYLKVDTASAPGAGIVGETIQFHGGADTYDLNGAIAIATLYSDAVTATPNPAVTVRDVGPNGGQAAAFTYDLARSVVYTRQGNPAWADDERDGISPLRSDDLFYGAKPGDVQADWVDLDKVAIPQADEQQRLLANMIEELNADREPLPRFWYLPRDEKAAIVMTGDDHGNGGTAGRFELERAASAPGCVVADWECVRSTSYVYPGTPVPGASGYEADGFEIGLHPDTGCATYTLGRFNTLLDDQLASFAAAFPGLEDPTTNRNHCIAWGGWAVPPTGELAHDMRLDTNYYYWPGSWVQDRPGMFTGSGMPMRFADLDGSMIDVYQAATQMTDESGQSLGPHADALLDKALGAEGYYGAFTTNMHTDSASHPGWSAIVASAQSRDVPIISARQLLEWVDARNASSFDSIDFAAEQLSFTIAPDAAANGLRAMVPRRSKAGTLTGVERNGTPVPTVNRTIKGLEYAFIDADAGSYVATYAPPTPSLNELTDTTSADFSAGEAGADAYLIEDDDGEVIAAPREGSEFDGPGLPAGWSVRDTWGPGGTATISSGRLGVDGASAGTDATFGPGRTLEFEATFSNTPFAHVGFGVDYDNSPNWAMFSVKNDGSLHARSNNGSSAPETSLGSGLIGSRHTYRIEWDAGEVRYYVDDALVATHAISYGMQMRPLASDFTVGGGGLQVEWLRMSPYASPGTFTSRVFDAGQPVQWGALSWDAETPAGTSVELSVRTGSTPTPDDSWSGFTPIAAPGDDVPGTSRYVQYRAELTSSDPDATARLNRVTLAFDQSPTASDDAVTFDQDSGPKAVDVLGNDGDPDGGPKQIVAKTNGSAGTVTITDGGSGLTYEPDPGYCNTDASGPGSGPDDSFTYTLNGGSTATVSVTVTCAPMPVLSVLEDTTTADFSAGETGSDTYVSEVEDGELTLAPTEGSEFAGGPGLPSGFSQQSVWNPGGAATVSGGKLGVDGASAGTDATFGAGRTLEFEATFPAGQFTHVGFGVDYNAPPWAMFSVRSDGSIAARSDNGASAQETALDAALIGSSHRYRIEWDAAQVRYYVDDGLVATHAISFGAAEMRPLASDLNSGGGVLSLDWLRISPYASPGSFTSRVFDAGSSVEWGDLDWLADTPAGTSVELSVRTGSTPTPDDSWSGFTPIAAPGDDVPGTSRYVQYRAELTSSDPGRTPTLSSVKLAVAPPSTDATDPEITIDRPYDGARYSRFADPKPELNSDYACSDADSGIDSCVGTVADGDPFDRSTNGTKTFTVTATDSAGNTATKSVTYRVFSFAGLIANDDPLAHYRLGDPEGSSSMAAAAGPSGEYKNGQHAVPYGISGDGDAARRFSGADGYGYANGIAAPRSYTLSAFFRLEDANPAMILQHGSAGAIWQAGGRIRFRAVDWNGLELRSPATIAPGSFHHVAASYEWMPDPQNDQLGTGTAKLYIDGELVDTGSADKQTSGASTFYLGYGDKAPWLRGALDEVAYFPKALSPTHVHEIWLADPPPKEEAGESDGGNGDTGAQAPAPTAPTPGPSEPTADQPGDDGGSAEPTGPGATDPGSGAEPEQPGEEIAATGSDGAVRIMSAAAKKKKLKVKLNCTGGDCAGTLGASKGKRKLGSKGFEIANDRIRTIRIKLSKQGRRALKRSGRIKLEISSGRQTLLSERHKLDRRR